MRDGRGTPGLPLTYQVPKLSKFRCSFTAIVPSVWIRHCIFFVQTQHSVRWCWTNVSVGIAPSCDSIQSANSATLFTISDRFWTRTTKLLLGARNAIESSVLAIQSGERVALIADLPSKAVAASLAAALKERDTICEGFLLTDSRAAPVKRSPTASSGRARSRRCRNFVHGADDRRAWRAQGHRRGCRAAATSAMPTMIGVTPEVMQQDMRADYDMVDRLSERLCNACTPRARSPCAPEPALLVATFDAALDWVKTCGPGQPPLLVEIAAGEVFTTPAKVDGILSAMAPRRSVLPENVATCSARRWCWKFRRAICRKATCERKDLEEEFWSYCHTTNSDRVGELAFGTPQPFRHDRRAAAG